MERAIFVSDRNFLSAPIAGGVQVCTTEFMALFREAGFDLHVHPVSGSRSLPVRAKLRLGIDVYSRYDFQEHAAAVARTAGDARASLVLLNQADLLPLAPLLRSLVPPDTLIVLLSHGNDSGDFLHAAGQPSGVGPAAVPAGALRRMRDHWRLGALLAAESRYYRHHIDLVACLSDTEQAIDRWLGARHVLVVPRTLHADFLPWSPVRGRIGFVGTLDHVPNRAGLAALCEELAKSQAGELPVQVRVVGGGGEDAAALRQRFPFINYLGPLDDAALHAEAATWSVFVNPLFWHARGASTKLATAIGWGIPVVTTPAGRRGYEWSDGKLPEPTEPAEMAQLLVGLLRDEAALRALQTQVRLIACSGPLLPDLAARLNAEIAAARVARAGAP